MVYEAVAVRGEEDDAVEYFLGGVEEVLFILLGASVREALEKKAVEKKFE